MKKVIYYRELPEFVKAVHARGFVVLNTLYYKELK